MIGSAALLLPAAAVIAVLLSLGLALFFGGLIDRGRAMAVALAVPATVAFAAGGWLLLGADLFVALYQGAVAAVAVCAVLAVGLRDGRLAGYLAFAVLWVALVLVPVGYALFDVTGGLLIVRIGTIDFAATGVIAIATGTAGLALAVTVRRPGEVEGSLRRPLPVLAASGLLGAVGWVALAVGAELVVDGTTPTIVANLLWAMGAGLLGWVLAQLVNVHRPTAAGVVGGLFAGAIVVLAGVPWLESGSSAVLGGAAGILGHVSASAARRIGAGHWAALVGVCLVPGALGLLATGIVARGVGLVYSGQAALLGHQATGLAIVFGYSLAVTLLIAFAVQRTIGLQPRDPIG